MAIFDQRAGMTWGSDLLRIVTNMQQLQMQREQLEMEKERQKLAERQAKHQLQLQEAGLQQILGMPQTIESISPAQANQIADATQQGRDATYLAARQGATKAIETGSPAEAAVAAQFLDLPPELGLRAREEAAKAKAQKGLDILFGDLPGQELLTVAQLAEASGQPQLASQIYTRWASEYPDASTKLAQEGQQLANERTRVAVRQGLMDLEFAPIELGLKQREVQIREKELDFEELRFEFQKKYLPIDLDIRKAQLRALQLDNSFNSAMNPLRISSAGQELVGQRLTNQERQAAIAQREREQNGETLPQQQLATMLTDVGGLSPEEADATVRGLDAAGASRAIFSLIELDRADENQRRQYAFQLFREFAMPTWDDLSQQWRPAAITDPEVLNRVVGNLYGEVLPTDELAMQGVGTLYSLIAGGENPSDPAVRSAVVAEQTAALNDLLTGGGLVAANALTSVERAELAKALDLAATASTLNDAYLRYQRYIEKSTKLRDLRNRLSTFDAANRAKTLIAERLYRGTAENAFPGSEIPEPLTLEEIIARNQSGTSPASVHPND